jgi:hypothetical protein
MITPCEIGRTRLANHTSRATEALELPTYLPEIGGSISFDRVRQKREENKSESDKKRRVCDGSEPAQRDLILTWVVGPCTEGHWGVAVRLACGSLALVHHLTA